VSFKGWMCYQLVHRLIYLAFVLKVHMVLRPSFVLTLSLSNHQPSLLVARNRVIRCLYLYQLTFKSHCFYCTIFLYKRFGALASQSWRFRFLYIFKLAFEFGKLHLDNLFLVVNSLQLFHLDGWEHRTLLQLFLQLKSLQLARIKILVNSFRVTGGLYI
jgi:hypothetical protein